MPESVPTSLVYFPVTDPRYNATYKTPIYFVRLVLDASSAWHLIIF